MSASAEALSCTKSDSMTLMFSSFLAISSDLLTWWLHLESDRIRLVEITGDYICDVTALIELSHTYRRDRP